jgi:two-component system, OmpR family, response regulator VanR
MDWMSMPKMLVVEDSSDICDVLALYLKEQGYRVITASDRASAQRAMDREDFDLAIIDIVLPRSSGLDLAGAISGRGIPVLLISGDPNAIAKLDGCSSYPLLAKPFHLRELETAVRSVLSRPNAAAAAPSDDRADRALQC